MNKRIQQRISAIGVLVMTGAAAVACGESQAGESQPAADLATAELRTIDLRAEAAGEVEPIRIVDVKSKASGEVLAVHVESGDVVQRGDLLVEIDPRDVRNELAQAQAELAVAEARVNTARSQMRRAEELLAAEIMTEQEYESTALELANAESQFVRAQNGLELAEERMGDVTIRAPIDGTIISEAIEVGSIIASASNNISGGETLMQIADLSEIQVRTLVDEVDIGRLMPGQLARVRIEAFPDRPFEGRVQKIEPLAVVEQDVTMFPVLIRIDNPDGLLKPGMNGEVAIEISRRADVVTVPNAAIVSPADAMAAAELLGLDADAVAQTLRGGGPAASGPAPADDGDGDCAELLQRVRGGDRASLSDEDRGRLRECMPARGGQGGFGGGAPSRFAAGGPAAAPSGGSVQDERRPGVVFVRTTDGLEARRVTLGINDWDHTEIVDGIEAGEEVMLMSVARIQQQQEEMQDRFRERASGPLGGR